jgi:hypothetical protein
VTVWNDTHRSLVSSMRILRLNEKPDLTKDPWALASEPVTKSKIFPAPESELLDRLAPGWQLRLHDGAVIDHILEVINKPRKSRRNRASLSNRPRWLRPGARQKAPVTLPQPLYSSSSRP